MAKKPYKYYCYIGKTEKEDKPIIGCYNCKYCDEKITAEPCMICSPYCDKWEAKEE